MCFGGGSSSSSASSETFSSAVEIYNRFRYNSQITSTGYIDPAGYEYDTRAVVSCSGCMFGFGSERCIIYKEKGWSDRDISQQMSKANRENYCDYFLDSDWSEGGDNEDEIAKKAARKIQDRLY